MHGNLIRTEYIQTDVQKDILNISCPVLIFHFQIMSIKIKCD